VVKVVPLVYLLQRGSPHQFGMSIAEPSNCVEKSQTDMPPRHMLRRCILDEAKCYLSDDERATHSSRSHSSTLAWTCCNNNSHLWNGKSRRHRRRVSVNACFIRLQAC
jgi:hypothetical protein